MQFLWDVTEEGRVCGCLTSVFLHPPLWPNERGAGSKVTRVRLSEKDLPLRLSVVASAYLFFCIGSRCHVELVQQSAEGWLD